MAAIAAGVAGLYAPLMRSGSDAKARWAKASVDTANQHSSPSLRRAAEMRAGELAVHIVVHVQRNVVPDELVR